MLPTALRILALVMVPAFFSMSIDRDAKERPQIMLLEPQVATPGEVVAAHGVSLERSRIGELMLVNDDKKAITHIVEQRTDLIRFRVPRSIDPGDYRVVLVVDTRWGSDHIDQNLMLTVVGVIRSGL